MASTGKYSNQLPQAYCGVTLLPSGGFRVSGTFREIEVLKAAMPFSWRNRNMRIIQPWQFDSLLQAFEAPKAFWDVLGYVGSFHISGHSMSLHDLHDTLAFEIV